MDNNELPVLQIKMIEDPPLSVGLYEKYELSFLLSRDYINPFDPREISVEVIFTAQTGKTNRIPAFWYQDVVSPGSIETTGEAYWKARFAPMQTGTHSVRIMAEDSTSQACLALPDLNVNSSGSDGFIHCTEEKPGRFVFDTGKIFFPIGEVLWQCNSRNYADPLDYFRKFISEYEANAFNHFRFFTGVSSGMPIRNKKSGPDRMDLGVSGRLDMFFDMIKDHRCYVNMGVELWNEIRTIPPFERWDIHPYNAANGGPCEKPNEYFTNDEAKRLYKAYLRYVIARWGYSPNLFLLQLHAEADYTEDYPIDAGRDWHDEMSSYFHSIDPYGHLLSSSLAIWRRDPKLFALKGLDVSLPEIYDIRDMGDGMYQDQSRLLKDYQKPCLVTECGLSYLYKIGDPLGIHFHNSLWGSFIAGAAGCPDFWMSSDIHNNGFMSHYSALARFIENEDLTGLTPLTTEPLRFKNKYDNKICANMIMPAIMHFLIMDPPAETDSRSVRISVPNDSISADFPDMPRIFYSKNGKDKANHNPLVLEVDFAADGEFIFYCYWMSDDGKEAVISVVADGDELGPINIPAAKGWEDRTEIYQRHCQPHSFQISKGKHEIKISNIGDNWAELRIDMFNYIDPKIPNLKTYGLIKPGKAFLWIHNRESTWFWDWEPIHREPRVVAQTIMEIRDMDAGAYDIEWWDTFKGEVLHKDKAFVGKDGDPLVLDIPEISRDIACKIGW